MKNTQNSLQLELHIPDFEVAKNFYKSLGFEVVWERKPEDFKGYLVLKNESDCIINFWGGNNSILRHPYFKKFSSKTKRGYAVEIVIPTQRNLKDLESELKDRGANIVEPLILQPWGLYDFRIEDPFGFYLRINRPFDNTDPENAVP